MDFKSKHVIPLLLFCTVLYFYQIFFHNNNFYQAINNENNIKLNNQLQRQLEHLRHMNGTTIGVLLMQGCSGSSAVFYIARRLLVAHNYTLVWNQPELFKREFNHLYERAKQNLVLQGYENPKEHEIFVESYRLYAEEAEKSGAIWIFKFRPFDTQSSRYQLASLQKMGALFGEVVRANELDIAVCNAVDCFMPSVGYPVLAANGSQTDLCFDRREKSEVKVKARFNTTQLIGHMHNKIRDDNIVAELVSSQNIDVLSKQKYEDLFAFEFTSDEEVFQSSVNLWYDLLGSITNKRLDENIIGSTLRPLQNTRQQESHDHKIYNFPAVVSALREADPPLDHFVRHPSVESAY